jgi:hypothetical protein
LSGNRWAGTERAEENRQLVENVFAQLDEMGATGFVQRCDEQPVAQQATVVGAHRMLHRPPAG